MILKTIRRVYPAVHCTVDDNSYVERARLQFPPRFAYDAVRHICWMVASESDWLVEATYWTMNAQGGLDVQGLNLVRRSKGKL